MNTNPFTQTEITYKISTKCLYRDLDIIEEEYIQNNIDDVLSVSTFELSSLTIDAAPQDVWGIEIYLSTKPDIDKVNFAFIEFCGQHNINVDNQFVCEVVDDCDWVSTYAKQLQPIDVGRFFVSSIIHKALCPPYKMPIYIEASRAFGTGQHETTKGCIEALEYLATSHTRFANILDIGTGTGILAICAKKIWSNSKVYACDIEKIAVEIAIHNAELNNVDLFVYENQEDTIILPNIQDQKFDLIISNILAKPLIDLSSTISSVASANSYLILSGFLTTQISDILYKFKEYGWQYIDCLIINSWGILILKLE